MADLVIEGARTLAFVRSRRGAELTALAAKRMLPRWTRWRRVAAYRAGYLAEDRRALERRWTAVSCSAWPARTRWSSAWTSPGWTRWWWPATRARWRRSGSRPGAPGGPGTGRWWCSWPGRTRWTPIWCTTRRRCWSGRSRPRCWTRGTRTSWRRTWRAPRPSCRSPRRACDGFGGRPPRGCWSTNWSPTDAAASADRLVLDVPGAAARVGRHPWLRRRAGGGGGGGLRADARHRRPGIGVLVGASGGGVPAPGRVVRGGRAGSGAGSGAGARRGPGVDHAAEERRGHLGGAGAGTAGLRRGQHVPRRGGRDLAGGRLPAPAALGRGARPGAAGPAGADAAHQGGLVHDRR